MDPIDTCVNYCEFLFKKIDFDKLFEKFEPIKFEPLKIDEQPILKSDWSFNGVCRKISILCTTIKGYFEYIVEKIQSIFFATAPKITEITDLPADLIGEIGSYLTDLPADLIGEIGSYLQEEQLPFIQVACEKNEEAQNRACVRAQTQGKINELFRSTIRESGGFGFLPPKNLPLHPECIEQLDLNFVDALITNESIQSIAMSCPKIRLLKLARTRITDASIEKVSKMPELEYLDLSFCENISTACFESLIKVTKLQKLLLESSPITHKDLLKSLSGQSLLMKVTELTPEEITWGVEQLKREEELEAQINEMHRRDAEIITEMWRKRGPRDPFPFPELPKLPKFPPRDGFYTLIQGPPCRISLL